MAVDVTLTGTNLTGKNGKPQLDGAEAAWKGTPTATSGVVSVPTTTAKTVAITVKNDDGESSPQSFTVNAAAQLPTLSAIAPTSATVGD